MGILEDKVEEIFFILSKIENQISTDRSFELGVDRGILKEMEVHIERISSLLRELETAYDSKPFGERKPYFDAIRVVHELHVFLKEIRRKEAGNTENTQIFLEHVNDLKDFLHQIPFFKPIDIKQQDYPNTQTNTLRREEHNANEIFQQPNHKILDNQNSSVVIRIPAQSRLVNVFRVSLAFLLITTPKVLGRAILEVFGREKVSESTQVLVGYIIIIAIILGLVLGSTAISFFKDAWRFFFPVQQT